MDKVNIKFHFVLLLFCLVFSKNVMAKNPIEKRMELFDLATTDAPVVAKFLCTKKMGRHFFLESLKSPLSHFSQMETYYNLRNIYFDLDSLVQHPSSFVRSLNYDNSYTATFNVGLKSSLKHIVFLGDPFDIFEFHTFYLAQLLESRAFENEIANCQEHFGVQIPDLLNKIKSPLMNFDRAGYISGFALSFIGMYSAWKNIAKLPKYVRWTINGAMGATIAWLAFDLISNAIQSLDYLEEPLKETEAENFTDVYNWALIYNQLLTISKINIEIVEGNLSEVELKAKNEEFSQLIKELSEKKLTLEVIYQDYSEALELNQSQQAEKQLVFYGLELIRFQSEN